ncbi:hypothetical protein Kfla_5974 [Kribbella flavida DSM 17836]|uniref:Uncharacterized protein n=1 Tax=Kribbella flavida (strain DSM 17836 / JCM 10339 / NBRC 14399) TaxID=479435 RepID=D2PSS5_KRIFD|nr:hypothetical protein [Kribbella flavida]ADB34977.1 hypothetical protein Kfla_5974 [Kribbella flavida DSM 17836]
MTLRTPTAVAPAPPGRIGSSIPAAELLAFLDALGTWRDRRRAELDELDHAALHAPDADALSADVVLSMAVWKAVSDRYELILLTWDSGRVGPTETERISTLIWGGLDTGVGARSGASGADAGSGLGHGLGAGTGSLAVSLPEACTLSDALAATLRAKLALDPGDADLAARLRQLRAQVERINDLVAREPAISRNEAIARHHDLDRRVTDLAERSKRGADVGGLIGPLEIDAARVERDLIVGSATRRERAADVARARTLRTELEAEGAAVRALADRCVAQVQQAPRLGVPDVTALGPVPNTPAELEKYLTRLDAVRRALGQAQSAYGAALERRDELAARLDAYRVKAGSVARTSGTTEDLAELYRRGREVLKAEPVDLVRLQALVAAYQTYLDTSGTVGPAGRATGGTT